MKPALFASALILMATSSPALAATTPVEAVQTCLADNTSGKDRKLLAKWIFLAMAAHPELKSLSSVSEQAREDTSREFAGLITRLLTVDCKAPMREMIANGGDITAGMKVAFTHLGQVAMQELMAHKDVDAAISQFGNYIDEDKLKAALNPPKGN